MVLKLILALAWSQSGTAGIEADAPADVSLAEVQASGDAAIRAPFGFSEIVVSTTTRLAGAIHSITWNGREFIDSSDHGRQIQSAASFDNSATAVPETRAMRTLSAPP